MFREMRRKNQQLSEAECLQVLDRGTHGVLALEGDEGYPYAVPISYAYDEKENCFYFHGAKSGHKLDAVHRCARASFCVVDQDQIVPERFTTYFRSVIAFGRIHEITDETEKKKAIEAVACHYSPEESEESREKEIRNTWKALCLLRFDVEHMTGKEAIELVREKNS